MGSTGHIIHGVLSVLIVLGVLGWWMYRSLRRSEEPVGLIAKWLITALVIPAIFLAGGTGVFMPIFGAIIGIVVAGIWARSIAGAIARPFVNLFTGGETPPDPQPYYSIAEAKRKKGEYHEAVSAIQQQLQKFPNDITGQVMLAEIQAENLNDLPGAQLTIERLCQQPGHAPGSLAVALHRLADWHLKFGQDVPAARHTLEKIVELFPDTEQAQMAAQRIAHLGSTESLLAPHDRQAIRLRPGVDNVGLLKDSSSLQKAPEDLAAKAAEYVKHLEAHPLDSEAREKLAIIYAEHYQRLDLATDQLEQLIQQPTQPAKQKAHWLNLLASLHIHHGHDYEMARGALQRIIDTHAGTALASQAEQRLAHLRLDLKGKEDSHSVKLGAYDQNIGLKSPPKSPRADRH
jgi:tetratricopeptide (TPR) repeat protein